MSEKKKKDVREAMKRVIATLLLNPDQLKEAALNSLFNGAYSPNNMGYLYMALSHNGHTPSTPEEHMFLSKTKWAELGRKPKESASPYGVFKPEGIIWIPVLDEDEKEVINVVTGKKVMRKIPKSYREIHTAWWYGDTEGEPIATPDRSNLVRHEDTVRFQWFAENAPMEVRRIPKGKTLAEGFTDGIQVVISDPSHKGEAAAMLATLFHKTAHVLMHGRNPELGEDVARSVRELEAIAVEFVVCEYFGITNLRARNEILAWGGSVPELEEHADRVLSTADKIIKHYEAIARREASGAAAETPEADEEEVA